LPDIFNTISACECIGNIDVPIHFRVLSNLATHPNVYGAVVISLEDNSHRELKKAIAATGRPVAARCINEEIRKKSCISLIATPR